MAAPLAIPLSSSSSNKKLFIKRDCVTRWFFFEGLEIINNRYGTVLSLHALIVSTMVCFLVDGKIKLLLYYLLIMKIHPVTHFKGPKAAILTLKLLTGSRLWFCTIIQEAACDKLILAHFPSSQREVGIRKHRSITKKGIVSNYKEANKKLILVKGSVPRRLFIPALQ